MCVDFLDGSTDAKLVLCLHGLNASCMQFDGLATALVSKQFKVLRFDFWGHGLSADISKKRLAEKPLIEILMEQISEVMELLDLLSESMHLVGFSMGGYIAVELVQRKICCVDRLVLISPAGTIPVEPPNLRLLKSKAIWPLCRPMALGLHWICSRFVNSRKMQVYYSDGEIDILPGNQNWERTSRRNLGTLLYCARGLPLWRNTDLFETVAKRAIPLLLCFGDADQVTPLHQQLEWLRKIFPLMEYKSYAGCHHVLLDDASPSILLDVCEFLTKSLDEFGLTQMPQTLVSKRVLQTSVWGSEAATMHSTSLYESSTTDTDLSPSARNPPQNPRTPTSLPPANGPLESSLSPIMTPFRPNLSPSTAPPESHLSPPTAPSNECILPTYRKLIARRALLLRDCDDDDDDEGEVSDSALTGSIVQQKIALYEKLTRRCETTELSGAAWQEQPIIFGSDE
eukprot:Blabericola_migrator_1__4873@NODE_254_length_10809_cov_136_023925_g213_i0_p3_GENE_NODE_254_length_10809_cov_136_023925_g213_i0NODE_254_length_10809_cov_136_023925_g213_i0_p3_ORF_typecomplete_len456_score66_04Hydrolase_4/PF12146_8/1_5e28Abhydrolase_1/PF00561_20/9_9e19Abhydrolase_6/PF12697_7/1_6e15Abhydrolase_6/PF12697_7/1_7e03DUF1057/PF06342_12/1_5e11Chlorophyllase2/PF12740_7/2_9e09Abhydrolase_2/PF02230_16/0_0027Abhydrolase_2/PF02230_16/0_0057DLH/PF01738_18/2_4e08UPF0227/PF05728_12/3_5e05UPF0227/